MEDTSIRGRLTLTLEGGSLGPPCDRPLTERRVTSHPPPQCEQGRPTHNAPEAVGPGQAPLSSTRVAAGLAWFQWASGTPPPSEESLGTPPPPTIRKRIFRFLSLVPF